MLLSKETDKRGQQAPRIRREPAYAYSDGADAGKLATAYGMEPDPWQQMVLDCWLGRDENDKFTSTTCGLSVPRQNGKNAIIEMRELYGICVNGESILHTAHEVKTARKAFNRLASFFSQPDRYPELVDLALTIRRTNGQESILLKNGGFIEFSARSRGAARGFTCDVVVLDECQELTDEQLEALMYAISASPNDNRQMIYTGTPPSPRSPGTVFPRIRDSVMKGNADPATSWHEWSVSEMPSEKTSTEELVKLAYETNPAMGIRITEKFTRTEAATSSPDGFARERLGWWSSHRTGRSVFEQTEWEKCRIEDPPEDGVYAVGVRFASNDETAALAIAQRVDERIYTEVIEVRPMSVGIQWIADFACGRKEEISTVVADGRNGTDVLAQKLIAGGFPRRGIVIGSSNVAIAAASEMHEAVKEGKLAHIGQPGLDESVLGSIRRDIGGNGGWGFAPGTADCTPLEACALAVHGVINTKRNPKRKQQIIV